MKPVALFTHPACAGHDPGPYHPECPARLQAVLQALEHPDFVSLLREQVPEATREQLERAHLPAMSSVCWHLSQNPARASRLIPTRW